MMTSIDPLNGQPFGDDVIQRVLFVSPKVHIYQPPPLTSTKGYMASTWTADNNKRCIFENARLRIIETAVPSGPASGNETVTTNILLEDAKSGELFAAAPYTSAAVVEQVLDSSRFFAVRVQGEGGRRAVLGIGFEDRSEAFDFGVSLQEARKALEVDKAQSSMGPGKRSDPTKPKVEERRDYSLKAGETITVNIGGKGTRIRGSDTTNQSLDFGGTSLPLLPPPPSAEDVKSQRRKSQQAAQPTPVQPSAADLGFDDGEFGEFQ